MVLELTQQINHDIVFLETSLEKGKSVAIAPYIVNLESSNTENPNVIAMYKTWSLAEIRADLQDRRTPLVNVCMNLTNDFNKASVIRANNAFVGAAVYIVGRRKFNRVGTVGTHCYENVYSAETLDEVVTHLKADGYTIYGVDNLPEYSPQAHWDVDYPKRSAFIYGEEQRGLQPEELALCDAMVYIQQDGSVRSLNVAQAAACIMSEYSRQHRR